MPDRPSQPTWHSERPYQALPPLPPRAELETPRVFRALIRARAALGRLQGAARLLPNPGVLVSTLPLLESEASCRIENIVTTADALFEFRGADAEADPATTEALSYSYALLEGFESLKRRPLCTATAEEVCSRIKGQAMRVRQTPGTALVREDEQGQREVIYTPPEGEDTLRELLANWERFLHETSELDALTRIAAAHYQFEAVHPFADGNGRAGRVLNVLAIVEAGLLDLPILFLSRYLIEHRSAYYAGLLAVTVDGAWEPWAHFMVQGVAETAEWTCAKVESMRKLMDHTAAHARAALGRAYRHEIVEAAFEQPYCRIATVSKAAGLSRQAASRALHALASAGVLEERQAGRERLFVHRKFLALLTEDGHAWKPYS